MLTRRAVLLLPMPTPMPSLSVSSRWTKRWRMRTAETIASSMMIHSNGKYHKIFYCVLYAFARVHSCLSLPAFCHALTKHYSHSKQSRAEKRLSSCISDFDTTHRELYGLQMEPKQFHLRRPQMLKIHAEIGKTKAKLGIIISKFNYLSSSVHHYNISKNNTPLNDHPHQINLQDVISSALPYLSTRVTTARARTDAYLHALEVLPSSVTTFSLRIQSITVKDYFYLRNGLITIQSCHTDLRNMLSYYEKEIITLQNISQRFSNIVVKVQLQHQKQHYEALYKKMLAIQSRVDVIGRRTAAELANQFTFV